MEYVQSYPIIDFPKLRDDFITKFGNGHKEKMLYGDYNVKDPSFTGRTNSPKSKDYFDIVMRMIHHPIQSYVESWNCNAYEIQTIWCHQYNDGGEYIHHTHSLANMAGVVHLLLEDERDYTNIEGYETPIKEGEVVLFPSMQPHKCDPVHARKITINFNWDMHGDMEYYHPVQ